MFFQTKKKMGDCEFPQPLQKFSFKEGEQVCVRDERGKNVVTGVFKGTKTFYVRAFVSGEMVPNTLMVVTVNGKDVEVLPYQVGKTSQGVSAPKPGGRRKKSRRGKSKGKKTRRVAP